MIFTSTVIWQIVCVVILSVVYASFFEWNLHRFFMHRPVWKFDYAFKAHAVVHHQTFKADHTYHLLDEKDKWTIPMAWWNGPALTAISTAMFLPFINWLFDLPFAWVFISMTIFGYYLVYEYLHWCMHLPKKRGLERSGLFFRHNGHHLLHQRYRHKDFNVVLPLADFCLGTLLRRSLVHFAQATGPAVPNVQPRHLRESETLTQAQS